jgi:hypothetical protein
LVRPPKALSIRIEASAPPVHALTFEESLGLPTPCLTGYPVYLRQMPVGTVIRADRYQDWFGDLRTEARPKRWREIKGETVAAPRHSLTWSAWERYEPKSAVALASRLVPDRS